MHFAKEMLEIKDQLEEIGHCILIPPTTQDCLANPELTMNLEYAFKNDVQKDHFNKIAESDAILVLNYPKNGVHGYIGGSVLMEMAVASHLKKKIFLLFSPPKVEDLRYSVEIQLTKPIVLNGDLNSIV
jgi:hypothetical protein